MVLENVFIRDRRGRIALADYGFTSSVDVETKSQGTPAYFSPQIIHNLKRGHEGYRPRSSDDIFALGVLIMAMVQFAAPNIGREHLNNPDSVFLKMKEFRLPFEPTPEEKSPPPTVTPISEDFKNLIYGMVRFRQEARLTAEQVYCRAAHLLLTGLTKAGFGNREDLAHHVWEPFLNLAASLGWP
jgi:serine/threonine protein kinase